MGLGMPEVVLILVIALIVFGPRKLPELGKSLGQAMAQFRRASDDFKRTWEQEVELDKSRTLPAADTSNTVSSSYDHDSTGANDPYNPYTSDTSDYTADHSATEGATTVKVPDAQPNAESEPVKVAAAAAGTADQPAEKKHWI